MPGCRVCYSPVETFIEFGRMPLANGFLTPEQFAGEYFFNLSAGFCQRCGLVQLVDQPERGRMFNDRYPFFTSTSSRMSAHFVTLARDVRAAFLPPQNGFVVEIGSNDGTLLLPLAEAGVRHLGIEPSASVALAAVARGVNTRCQFFDAAMARQIVAEQGQAHAVIAVNALSHVGDPHAVVEGIQLLLDPGGVCVIEDPYWGEVVAQTAFDQIYDEHASYFTLTALAHLFEAHGLAVVDVTPQAVHGGSLRYVISHAGQRTVSDRVPRLLEAERHAGLHRPATFTAFRDRVSSTRDALVAMLRGLKQVGKRVVGYGATSKSTTTINYCGITTDLVEFISDTTPAKQGTFSPGAHIPVRPHEQFAAAYPDRALLFSWNHADEIRAKEQVFSAAGGRWIVYVPAVAEL